MTILVFDITSYLKGKKGYLVGRQRPHVSTTAVHAAKDEEILKRLGTLSDGINNLSNRINQINMRLNVLGEAVERKARAAQMRPAQAVVPGRMGVPMNPYQANAMPIHGHIPRGVPRMNNMVNMRPTNMYGADPYPRFRYPYAARKWDMRDDSEQMMQAPPQRPVRPVRDMRMGHRRHHVRPYNYGNNRHYTGPSAPFAVRKNPVRNNYAAPAPSEPRQLREGSTPTNGQSFRPKPEPARVAVAKPEAPSNPGVETYSPEIQTPRFLPNTSKRRVNMQEMIASMNDKDTIVEVKHFDDLEAFRNFTKNQIESKNSDNGDDGAQMTSYYRMGDIVGGAPAFEEKPTVSSKEMLDFIEMVSSGKASESSDQKSSSQNTPSATRAQKATPARREVEKAEIPNIFEHYHAKSKGKGEERTDLFDNIKKMTSTESNKPAGSERHAEMKSSPSSGHRETAFKIIPAEENAGLYFPKGTDKGAADSPDVTTLKLVIEAPSGVGTGKGGESVFGVGSSFGMSPNEIINTINAAVTDMEESMRAQAEEEEKAKKLANASHESVVNSRSEMLNAKSNKTGPMERQSQKEDGGQGHAATGKHLSNDEIQNPSNIQSLIQ